MAISFRSTTTATSTSSIASINVAVPASVAIGDVVIIVVTAQGASTPPDATCPDFVQLAAASNVTLRVTMLRKVLTAVDSGNYTVSFSVNSTQTGIGAVAYIGVDNTTPEDATATAATGSDTTVEHTALTTVTNDAWLVTGVGVPSSTTTIAEPTGFTERHDQGGRRNQSADKAQATAGATGTHVSTLSVSRDWVGLLGALRPAGAGGSAFTLSGSATAQAATGTGSGLVNTDPGVSAFDLSGTAQTAVATSSGSGLVSAVPEYALTGSAQTAAATTSGAGLVFVAGGGVAFVLSGSAQAAAATSSGSGLVFVAGVSLAFGSVAVLTLLSEPTTTPGLIGVSVAGIELVAEPTTSVIVEDVAVAALMEG